MSRRTRPLLIEHLGENPKAVPVRLDMESVWQIFKRWWALMSCAAWTFLGLGFLKFNPTANIQITLYFALSGIFLVIAVGQTLLSQRERIHKLEQILPQITLVVEDIVRTRSSGPLGYWQYADIFVRASAHLHSPKTANIEYTLELIRHGNSTRTTQLADIHLWHIVERQDLANGQIRTHDRASSLQQSLSVMSKSEGWLHFQVEMSDIDVTKSRMRLNATSASGVVCVERDMIGTLIRPLMFRRMMA